MAALVISDVIGDPLDIIASGPTIEDSSTPEQALDVLDRLVGLDNVPSSIVTVLRERVETVGTSQPIDTARISTQIIGRPWRWPTA